MSDFIESNLYRPTAPSEYLLKKPRRKKLKVDESDLRRTRKVVIQGVGRAEGPAMTALRTKQRWTVSNHQNHLSTTTSVTMNCADEVPASHRCDHTDTGSSRLESPPESDQGSLTTGHKPDTTVTSHESSAREDASQPSRVRQSSDSEELLNSTPQNDVKTTEDLPAPPAEDVLLEASSPKEDGATEKDPVPKETQNGSLQGQPTDDVDMNVDRVSTSAGLESPQTLCNSELVNVSDIQEQFTKLNLKRCSKDPASQSNGSCDSVASNSLHEPPCHHSDTANPELGQGNSPQPEPEVTGPEVLGVSSVIDILVTPPDALSKPSSESVLLAFREENEMRRNFNKRKKLIRLLRYIFKIKWKRQGTTEDKQVLVQEEILDEEEDSCGQGVAHVRHRMKRPLSCHAADQTKGAAPPKKRRRPRKKNVSRAVRRVRRSMGRGCRYIGHGLANMTSLVPEAAYMSPVSPSKNYDSDYITSEYI